MSTVPQNVAGTRLALMHVEQRMAAQLRMSRIPHLAVAVSTPIRYAESLHRVRPLPPLVDSALQGEARKSNLLATQLLLAGFHNTEAAASFVHLGRDECSTSCSPRSRQQQRCVQPATPLRSSRPSTVLCLQWQTSSSQHFHRTVLVRNRRSCCLSLLVHSKVCAPEPLKDPS